MTTTEANAALVRRYLADAVAGTDRAAAEPFLTDAAAVRDVVLGDHPLGRPVAAATAVDLDGLDVVATPDRVAVRGTASGTLEAPTGRSDGRFEIAHAWFFDVEDGRIAAGWSLPDGLALCRQLGTFPGCELDTDTDSHP